MPFYVMQWGQKLGDPLTFTGPFDTSAEACNRFAFPGDCFEGMTGPALGDLNPDDNPCWQVLELAHGDAGGVVIPFVFRDVPPLPATKEGE